MHRAQTRNSAPAHDPPEHRFPVLDFERLAGRELGANRRLQLKQLSIGLICQQGIRFRSDAWVEPFGAPARHAPLVAQKKHVTPVRHCAWIALQPRKCTRVVVQLVQLAGQQRLEDVIRRTKLLIELLVCGVRTRRV